MTDQKVSGTKRIRGDRRNPKLSVSRGDKLELFIPVSLLLDTEDPNVKAVIVDDAIGLAKTLLVVE